MIIFGTKNTNRVIDTGVFACPSCGADRSYRHLRVRRWGHLFFIPLIPFGTPDEVVQCGTCRSQFRPEVLAVPTASSLVADLDQAVQLVAMAGIVTGTAERSARADAARAMLRSRGWTDDLVASTVDWSLQADGGQAADLHDQLCWKMSQVAPSLQLAGLEPIVTAYGTILGAGGTFDATGASLVTDLGRAAGLSAAHVQGIVTTVEASFRPS
jgi:hypothetical protein